MGRPYGNETPSVEARATKNCFKAVLFKNIPDRIFFPLHKAASCRRVVKDADPYGDRNDHPGLRPPLRRGELIRGRKRGYAEIKSASSASRIDSGVSPPRLKPASCRA